MRQQISAVLIALLLVAAPITGAAELIGTASARTVDVTNEEPANLETEPIQHQTQAPDGFVTIPDTNVKEDYEVGTNHTIRAHDLEGSVMASSNASSLQVIVTTPKRAAQYVNGSEIGGSAGGIALVLQDDSSHAGRKVALPAAAIRKATGGIPEVVHGVHEDGTGWSSEVKGRNGLLIFYVPHFSANTVTFDGTARITAEPAVNGSRYSYDAGKPDSVNDFQINVTGSTATAWDNESGTALGDGSQLGISIGGNAAPIGPSVNGEPSIVFTGRETLFAESVSGTGYQDGDTASFTVNGDAAPKNAEVTFTGYTSKTTRSVTSSSVADGGTISYVVDGTVKAVDASVTFTGTAPATTSASGSGTGSGSVSVNGNLSPTGESVSVTGRESTTAASGTGTGSGSVSVGGNLNPSGESVSVTGRESTTSDSSSGTGSATITVNGNLNPSGESVSVTGNENTKSITDSATGLSPGGSVSLTGNGNLEPTGPSANNEPEVSITASAVIGSNTTATGLDSYHTESSGFELVEIEPNTDGNELKIHLVGYQFSSNPIETVVVKRKSDGTKIDSASVSIAKGQDDYATLYGDFNSGVRYQIIGKNSLSDMNTQDDAGNNGGVTGGSVDLLNGSASRINQIDDVKLNSVPRGVSADADDGTSVSFGDMSDGQTATKEINFSKSTSSVAVNANGGSFDMDVNYTERTGTADPAIDVDGDGTNEASWTGIYASGESTTSKSVDGMTTGTNSVGTSTSAGPQPDWSLSWTERTGTADPAIDVDGDGTNEASWTGVYASGESSTSKSVDGLSLGSNSVGTTTTAGPQPDWTISWTERNGTESPSIDVNGDGTTDATHSGVLTNGQSVSYAVQNLSVGSKTASVALARHTTDVNLTFTERNVTKDPSVDVNGDGAADASYTGTLFSGESATSSLGNLNTGSVTADFSLQGPQMDWTINYDRVEHTENPGADLNGDNTPEAQYTGVLAPGETARKELSELDTTHDTVFVSTASSTETDLEIELQERTETVDPEVVVNGNSTGGATGRLADGETTSLTTDTSWIQDGQNNVTVYVGSGTLSSDAPTPQVDLNYSHSAEVQVEGTYTSGGWAESYNVSHTYAGDRQDPELRVPFSREIYRIANVEQRVNGGSWNTVPASSWELVNDTTLIVHLDDNDGSAGVEAGDEIRVRTTGYKVNSVNGAITVTDPTDPTDNGLDAGIQIDSTSSGFHLEVGGSKYGDRVHYLHTESWDSPEERAVIAADGSQEIYIPNAGSGDTARVTTIPLEAQLSQGDVGIHVQDPDKPALEIGPGESGTGDEVSYTWYNVESGEKYGLYSVPADRYKDKSDAGGSSVTLTDDDSQEVLVIKKPDGSSGGSGGGSGGGTGLPGTGSGVWESADGISLQEIAALIGWVGAVVLLVAATGRSRLEGRQRWIVVGILSAGSGLLVLEFVRPGSVSGAINAGLTEIIPLAGLAAIGLAVYSVVSWWQTRQKEAATPDRRIVISGEEK